MTTHRADHVAEAQAHIDAAHKQQEECGEHEFSVRDNALIANAEATLALVEEQRTANLVAAYNGDLLKNPHPVGSHEHDVWWAKTAGDLTERVGAQR